MTNQRCDLSDHLPTLRLSEDEIRQIDKYVAFLTQYAINGLQRQLSPIGMIDATWKPFKKRQNITLYKKKKKRSNVSNGRRPAYPSSSQNESFHSDTAALFAQSALEMTTNRRKAQLGFSSSTNSRATPFASLGPSSSRDFHRADFEFDTLTSSNLTNEISYLRRSCHSSNQSIFDLPDFASYDPDTMASGTIPGTLNDFLFGLHASDEIGQKQNNIYMRDGTVDSVLLCKLRGPSTSDPFQFAGIKGLLKNVSTLANPATRFRDFIVLEAVGSKTNSNGERFGYYILQSLDIGKVPKFESSGIHRGNLSVCVVAFEKSSTQKQSPTASTAGASNARKVDAVSGKLHIHCFASYARKCSAIKSASQRYLHEAIFSITNATNCAFMKRLAHAIQQNNVELVSMDMAGTRNKDDFSNQVLNLAKKTSNPYLWEENVVPSLPTFRPSVHQQSRGSHCSTCHRRVNLWRVMHKGKVCRLCNQVFCTRCSVDLKMLTQTTSSKKDKSNNIEMHSVRFCLPCVVKVRNLSTWDVALHSVHEQEKILASIQFCPF